MKILYYSSHPQLKLASQSGPGTHMREMIAAMEQLGHEILPVIMGDVFFSNSSNVVDNKSKQSFKSILKKIIPSVLWRTLKEYQLLKFDYKAESYLIEKIKTFQPDLVYERAAYMQLS